MKLKIGIFLVSLILLLGMSSTIGIADYEPMSPNYMGFDGETDVTIDDTVYIDIWVDVNAEVDTASIDNMTYTPGILDYESNTVFGDLFTASVVQMTPESNGVIDNVNGYCNPIVWGDSTPVNNTNGTLATCEWTASAYGTTTISISSGGTALSGVDPGTTFIDKNVNVHPMPPTTFSATVAGPTSVDLSWNAQIHPYTVVRRSDTGFPTSPTEGVEVYNNTGTSTTDTGLSPGVQYYYSAWGYDTVTGFFSLTYDTDTEATNEAPTFGTPSPNDGATDQDLSFDWQIPISDPESDTFDWTIECSNGQDSGDTSDSDGTKTLSLTGLDYSTTYTIWVNATDDGSGMTTSDSFIFTTKDNTDPVIGDISPEDAIDDVPLNPYLRVDVTDADGHSMDVEFFFGNSTLNVTSIGTDTDVATGDTASIQPPSILDYNTTYYWYVEVDDGYGGTARGPSADYYTFTTELYEPPSGGPHIFVHNYYLSVLDDQTSQPVENVQIKVYSGQTVDESNLEESGSTDQYGSYSVELEDDHWYTITIEKPGYEPTTSTFKMESDDITETIRIDSIAAGPAAAIGIPMIAIIIAIVALLGLFYIWYDRNKDQL